MLTEDVVGEKFAMSKFTSKSDRERAMFEEIVRLTANVNRVQLKVMDHDEVRDRFKQLVAEWEHSDLVDFVHDLIDSKVVSINTMRNQL